MLVIVCVLARTFAFGSLGAATTTFAVITIVLVMIVMMALSLGQETRLLRVETRKHGEHNNDGANTNSVANFFSSTHRSSLILMVATRLFHKTVEEAAIS